MIGIKEINTVWSARTGSGCRLRLLLAHHPAGVGGCWTESYLSSMRTHTHTRIFTHAATSFSLACFTAHQPNQDHPNLLAAFRPGQGYGCVATVR